MSRVKCDQRLVKQALFVLALAVAVPACGKHNQVDVLQHEATVAAKFYAPKVEALEARLNAIVKRGETITADSAPGVQDVGQRLKEARDLLVQLRGIVGPGPDGKSAVEKQAAEAAKNRRVVDLEKLVHDTHSALDRGLTVVNANLQSAEGWLAYYDRRALARAPGAAGAGGMNPAPSTTGTGGVPEVGAGSAAPAGGATPAGAVPAAGAAPAGAAPAPAAPGGAPAREGSAGAGTTTAPTPR